jgi:hypothetical protein
MQRRSVTGQGVVPFSRLYPHTRQRKWGIGDRSEQNCPILHKIGGAMVRKKSGGLN